MSVRSLLVLCAASMLCACATPGAQPPPAVPAGPPLRVCADPNNLPFSNAAGEGFENKLAELLAEELGRPLQYAFLPHRRGFIRNTLKAEACDVVMGVPVSLDMVATTAPYYRSTYVFVYGPGAPRVTSFAAPELRDLRIGVSVVGDDGSSIPPVVALGQRGLASNLRGYTIFGDYREESPPADVVRAVARGEVDLAIAWGPLAGYYAKRVSPPLEVAPLAEADAPPGMPFSFDIALGVRKSDQALRAELDGALLRRRDQIGALLDAFGVPRVEPDAVPR
jgi:mxaJ protein